MVRVALLGVREMTRLERRRAIRRGRIMVDRAVVVAVPLQRCRQLVMLFRRREPH